MRRAIALALTAFLDLACSPANIGNQAADGGPIRDGAPLDVGTGDGSTTSDGGVTFQQAAADIAFARCSHYADCSPTVIALRYGDLPTCRAIYKATYLSSLTSASTGASPSSQESCASKISGWDCNDYLNYQNPPPECAIPPGQLPNGSACGTSSQCQSTFCAIAPGSGCGKCATVPVSGDSCADLVSCPSSLSCQSTTELCEAFAQLNGTCGAGLPCAARLSCVGASGTQTGSCQAAVLDAGAPCTPQPAGPGCDYLSGVSCNTASGVCEPVQLAGNGQACGNVNNQPAYCKAEGTCVSLNGVIGSACVGAAGLGAPCDLVKGPGCLFSVHCIVTSDGGTAGTCQAAAQVCP
jgi:hypothetical protein